MCKYNIIFIPNTVIYTPKQKNEHRSHFYLGVPRRTPPGEMSQKLHDLLETITSLTEKNIADNV